MIDGGSAYLAVLMANVIMAVASALQASIGFGLALLAVPLLALVDPRLVPGPMLLAGSLLALGSAYRERHAVEVGNFGLSLLGLAIGTVLGAAALSAISIEHLGKVFAAAVLLAVALNISGLRVRPTPRALFAGGAAAGVMGTTAGIHGPPIALMFQDARPEHARAMLGAFFFIAYVGSVMALAVFGLFGTLELKLAAGLVPGVAIGLLAGPLLAGFVNPSRLRAAILIISASSAIMLLAR